MSIYTIEEFKKSCIYSETKSKIASILSLCSFGSGLDVIPFFLYDHLAQSGYVVASIHTRPNDGFLLTAIKPSSYEKEPANID